MPQVEDTRPVYVLPKAVSAKKPKVYPGVKSLPPHIRKGFCDMFIRVIIREVFNSSQPWVNPDLEALQLAYDKIFPTYPTRIQCGDTVFHPVGFYSLTCDGIS